MILSDCCHDTVTVKGFGHLGTITPTSWYECVKCKKPCHVGWMSRRYPEPWTQCGVAFPLTLQPETKAVRDVA